MLTATLLQDECMSNFKKKMYRSTALNKLSEVIERAEQWNAMGRDLHHGIARLRLFGSLAKGNERVGDIDLCVGVGQRCNSKLLFGSKEHKQQYRAFWKKLTGKQLSPDTYLPCEIRSLCWHLSRGDGRIGVLSMPPSVLLCAEPVWIDLIRDDKVLWRAGELPQPKTLSLNAHKVLLKIANHQIFPDGPNHVDTQSVQTFFKMMPDWARTYLLEIEPGFRGHDLGGW